MVEYGLGTSRSAARAERGRQVRSKAIPNLEIVLETVPRTWAVADVDSCSVISCLLRMIRMNAAYPGMTLKGGGKVPRVFPSLCLCAQMGRELDLEELPDGSPGGPIPWHT